MAVGPGKYDAHCTAVREKTGAQAVILIVLKGIAGDGFSCQADPVTTRRLPELLEQLAASIRTDLATGQRPS